MSSTWLRAARSRPRPPLKPKLSVPTFFEEQYDEIIAWDEHIKSTRAAAAGTAVAAATTERYAFREAVYEQTGEALGIATE